MELSPTAEQRELQETARRFLEREVTRERLLAWDRAAEGYDAPFWNAVGALGWIGLSLPERAGGGGGSLLDAALLLEECGRGLAPAAVSSAILGARTLSRLGGDGVAGVLPSLATGERQVTLALDEADGSRDPRRWRTRIDQGRLFGEKSYVRQAVTADWMIVGARDGDAPALVLVPPDAAGVSRIELRTFGGDRQSVVRFDRVGGEAVLAKGDAALSALARIRDEAAAFALAEIVGGFDAVVDMTVAYMKERIQFGQPLGKFQGVQFKCADLATARAGTRHTAFQAIWRLSEGLDATRELAIARVWSGETYKRATLEAHQLHGGAGYVVEHPLPRYSQRAQSLAILFCDEDDALAGLATQLLGPP